jgi:hypothetical protein
MSPRAALWLLVSLLKVLELFQTLDDCCEAQRILASFHSSQGFFTAWPTECAHHSLIRNGQSRACMYKHTWQEQGKGAKRGTAAGEKSLRNEQL